MPQGEFVSFSILYKDCKRLPEYTIRDKVYSEVNLHGPHSFFIEEDDQRYPVVPFILDITRNCEEVVWIKIYLDGQQLCSRPLCQQKFCCDGVKVGTEIRELLFSLPKIMENQEKKNPLGEFAGTIRLEVLEAVCDGQKTSPVYRVDPVLTSSSQMKKLQHLTKKDIPQNRDTVGSIVSREGRPTLYVSDTGHYRTLKRFFPRSKLMEELVLYYRPHISSHVSKDIKQEQIDEANSAPQQNEVGNTEPQQQSSGEFPSPDQCSMTLACREENRANPMEDVNVARCEAPPATAVMKTERRSSLMPLIKLIKQRDSFPSLVIPVEMVKHRESCASGLIPPEDIKHHESSASELIPPENIKQRKSCCGPMIPLGKIKVRESCGSAQIPPGKIKQQPYMATTIKLEQTESQWVIDKFVDMDDTNTAPATKVEQEESPLISEECVVIESDDDSENCIYHLEDDSVLYMGTEYVVEDEDSMLSMNEEDCCILDMSNHVSILEIDDTF